MANSNTANTRHRLRDSMRVAHPAPNHAPTRLPAYSVTITSHRWNTLASGIVPALSGNDAATTIRPVALLMMMAGRAEKPKTPMRRGSRNSAPPRPISPPNVPTASPLPKTVPLFLTGLGKGRSIALSRRKYEPVFLEYLPCFRRAQEIDILARTHLVFS